MPEFPLAEFEMRVMLGVLRAGDDAIAANVHAAIESRTGRTASLGAVYVTLDRLERKGLLRSQVGPSTPTRGGRGRRHYALTRDGMVSLRAECRLLARLWEGLGVAPGEP